MNLADQSGNAVRVLLNDMFPEVDLAYLRQSLLESPHSYLYSSLASLLSDTTLSPDAVSQWHAIDNARHRSRSVSSRRKHESLPKRQNPGEMAYANLIKDERYAEGTLQLLCAQFPNIWKSSIKAIMVSLHCTPSYNMLDLTAPSLHRQTATMITSHPSKL